MNTTELAEIIEQEKALVTKFTGARLEQIELVDESWHVRAYIVDGGKKVFKFPKKPETRFENEIKVLECLNTINADVNLQKVGWTNENNAYIGFYGVEGTRLDKITLNDESMYSVSTQLGAFLKKMHGAECKDVYKSTLKWEIAEWQKSCDVELFKNWFTDTEISQIEYLIKDYVPKTLERLGEKLVFSHGDLWEQNIIVDDSGKVGVIDFNTSGYMEEAIDFMGMNEQGITAIMLDAYGADKTLREKVKTRMLIEYVTNIKINYEAGNHEKIKTFVNIAKKRLKNMEVNNEKNSINR